MALSRAAVQQLYTSKIDHYSSFIRAFHSLQGSRHCCNALACCVMAFVCRMRALAHLHLR
jgi:hypothetical protein